MTPNTNDRTADADPPLPPSDDPGGAHAKGYSADPNPDAPEVPDPVPLVPAPRGGIHVPERDPWVHPTGRAGPEPWNPDERELDGGR